MHPRPAVISALQLQEANMGELKCNSFKNTSTLLWVENSFCEPSLLTKLLKQLHPCREEAGCVTCPNSSHQLLSCPLLAGQPWHHRAGGQRQNCKQAPVAKEHNHGSVSPTVQDSAFHSGAIDNTVIATCQTRYPTTCAAAEGAKILIAAATLLGAFRSEVHRFQTEKGLDYSSQSFGNLVYV